MERKSGGGVGAHIFRLTVHRVARRNSVGILCKMQNAKIETILKGMTKRHMHRAWIYVYAYAEGVRLRVLGSWILWQNVVVSTLLKMVSEWEVKRCIVRGMRSEF